MPDAKNLVLITGANQGIGFEIAKQLASSTLHPDYYVLLGSRDIGKGMRAAEDIGGDQVEAIQIDVTDLGSIEAAKKLVQQKWGRLDVLINNAGIVVKTSVFPPRSLGQAMQESFATNTIGVADLTEAFLPLLHQAELPRIVMISSAAGSLWRRANQEVTYTTTTFVVPAYDCSKAALNMLTLHYKNNLPDKFKVNTCCPGFRRTNLSGFDERGGPVEEGAINAIRLATLGKDGETGTFSNNDGPYPW